MSSEARWRGEPKTWAAIAVALLLWAAAFAGIRAGLESYGPGEIALLRFGTASVVLLGYAIATRMRLPDRRDVPVIALAGVLGITVYHVALNFGEISVTAGAAALLISSSPIFTALLSRFFLGEKLSTWGWIGVLVSFAGVALISLGEGGDLSFDPGAALVLLASLAASLYMIIGKRPLRRYNALEFTTYAIWLGTLPMLWFAPGLIDQLPKATTEATVAVVFLGVFPGAISYVLWSHALSKMPASMLATFLYFQPVNAILIAWVWLAEVPSVLAIVGGVISLAGVVIVNTRGTAQEPPSELTLVGVESFDDRAIAEARELFEEYADWLGDVVCTQSMSKEVESLPGVYAPPSGALVLARSSSGKPFGVVALRPHTERVCEVKRLFVREAARGSGVGRRLVEEAIGIARESGYDAVRMTTLPERMAPALALYRELGFRTVEPFEDFSRVAEDIDIEFLEMSLD